MKVCIIGIGLIGGSLAIDLKENGFASKVIGVDISQEHLDKAIRRRIIDEDLSLDEALEVGEIFILSTPINVMMQLLPDLLNRLKPNQILLDVGSTKNKLIEVVKNHPKRDHFIATHPMAGTEYSGPEAALPRLFDGKCTVICDAQSSDPKKVKTVEKLYTSVGSSILHLDGPSHDIHAAYVSHISHVSSFALAATVLAKEKDERKIFELASGGFDSTVRLAKSSPEMWAPIFMDNKDNLIEAIDEHIQQLTAFKTNISEGNFNELYNQIKKANEIKRIIK